jgi:hypothetical protein
MQKIQKLCTLCLLLACGELVSIESCPLFLKPAFELTIKDRTLLDILHEDVVSSKRDFYSLVEIDGRYPQSFEQAYDYFLREVNKMGSTRYGYGLAIRHASEYLADLLDAEEMQNSQAPQAPVLEKTCVALLIGINYEQGPNRLSSCIKDIDHVFSFLLGPKMGVRHENVIYMSDKQVGSPLYPTRENILRQFDSFTHLVNQTKIGYLHYSGHGTSVKDISGDELDGYDEALVPVDYQKSGVIIDDDIYATLVKKLDPDVQLLVVADCCHSGTILDLPYKWNNDGSHTVEHRVPQSELQSLASVVMLSGCRDDQTSADIKPLYRIRIPFFGGGDGLVDTIDSEGSGALTRAFLKVLDDHNYTITYRQLLEGVTQELIATKQAQRPQLTSSYLLNLDDYYLKTFSSQGTLRR